MVVVGPLVGGTFANPALNLGYYGPGKIFASFPWLLPCLISGLFSLCGCVITYCFLDETLDRLLSKGSLHPEMTDPLLAQTHDIPATGRAYNTMGGSDNQDNVTDAQPDPLASISSSNIVKPRTSQVAFLLSTA